MGDKETLPVSQADMDAQERQRELDIQTFLTPKEMGELESLRREKALREAAFRMTGGGAPDRYFKGSIDTQNLSRVQRKENVLVALAVRRAQEHRTQPTAFSGGLKFLRPLLDKLTGRNSNPQ